MRVARYLGDASPIDRARIYYRLFLTALIGCFLPSKVLPFGIPLVLSGWWLLRAGSRSSGRRAIAVSMGLMYLGVLYWAVSEEFIATNYALAIVTYSSFIPLTIIDCRDISEARLFPKMVSAVSLMLLIQGGLGIVQATYGATQTGGFGGANGDFVEGTIHPQLAAERAASGSFYAINMALMLLCSVALPARATVLRSASLAIGSVALVLASVMHVLLFLLIACALAVLPGLLLRSRGGRGGQVGRFVLIFAMVSGLTCTVMRTNVDLFDSYAETALDLDALESPRPILLYRVINQLGQDAPLQPWIGLGPGQFCSRASLLASGLFLGGGDGPRGLPFLPPRATSLAEEYCLSLIHYMKEEAPEGSIGSTQQPFSSWLNIYTELGGPAVVALLVILSRLGVRVWRRMADRAECRQPGMALVAGTAFLALIGLQEAYWEVPQGILIGLLLLKALYASLMHGQPAGCDVGVSGAGRQSPPKPGRHDDPRARERQAGEASEPDDLRPLGP